jgi:CheY-like chemotaxis protein
MAVLIVDDRPNARRYHRLWLQAQAKWTDANFIECSTLEQAIGAVRENTVEFVILDLNLDATNRGVATLERFLHESGYPARKVFVVTADSDNVELVGACIRLGVADVSNAGQPPWASPPQAFTDGQIGELERRITDAIAKASLETKAMIREELVNFHKEQAERDALKQHEGMLRAMKAVAGAVLFGLGSWILTSAAPVALKAVIASFMTGGKSQ